MQIVMGEVNGVFLEDLLDRSHPSCSTVWIASPYARQPHPLVEHCKQHNVTLKFRGLLDAGGGVDVSLLEEFLDRNVDCRLVAGRLHAKVIWWHGYGLYLGSANLTASGWKKNIECGVFYDDNEMRALGLEASIRTLFDHIEARARPLTKTLLAELRALGDGLDAPRRAVRADELDGYARLLSVLSDDNPEYIYAKAKLLDDLKGALEPQTPAHLAWAVHDRMARHGLGGAEIERELPNSYKQASADRAKRIFSGVIPEVATAWRADEARHQLQFDQMAELAKKPAGEQQAAYDELCKRNGKGAWARR